MTARRARSELGGGGDDVAPEPFDPPDVPGPWDLALHPLDAEPGESFERGEEGVCVPSVVAEVEGQLGGLLGLVVVAAALRRGRIRERPAGGGGAAEGDVLGH